MRTFSDLAHAVWVVVLLVWMTRGAWGAEEGTRGVLVDEAGKGVAGVKYGVYREEFPFEVKEGEGVTGADGGFLVPRSEEFMADSRTVVFDAAGFGWTWSSFGRRSVEELLGERRVALSKGAVVAGTVKDAAGKPVAGAEVELEVAGPRGAGRWYMGGRSGAVIRTDAQGAFVVERVPAGARCHVLVRAAGYVSFSTEEGYRGVGYPVAAGTTDVEVVLERGGTLVAQVVRDGKAAAVAGVPVVAYPESNERAAWGVTDAKGEARMSMKAGMWKVQVKPREGSDGIRPAEAAEVKRGEEVRVVLEAGGEMRVIRGEIVAEGKAVAGRRVTLATTGEMPMEMALARTDGEGKFSMRAPAGKYQVITSGFERNGPREYRRDVDATGADMAAVKVEVSLAGVWRGQLVDDAGKGVRGVVVRGFVAALTDGEGKFALASFQRSPGLEMIAARSADGKLVTAWLLEPGEALPETVLVERAAKVSGEVVDGEAKPAEGSQVVVMVKFDRGGRAVWQGVPGLWEAKVGADGKYVVEGVPSGREMMVSVNANGGVAGRSAVAALKAGEARAVGRIVAAGRPVLAQGGKEMVRGRIVDGEGRPVVGVTVRLGTVPAMGEGTSDLKGRFEVSGLPAGMVDLEGTMQGERTPWRVEAGSRDVELRWEPAAGRGRAGRGE